MSVLDAVPMDTCLLRLGVTGWLCGVSGECSSSALVRCCRVSPLNSMHLFLSESDNNS